LHVAILDLSYHFDTMQRSPMIAIVFASILAIASASQGAIVVLKDKAEPVFGTIVREERERIVVRTLDAECKPRDEILRRDQIDEIIPSVSSDRVAALDPARPSLYRDYAEELYARRRDPEARATAIRLYVIAAWLDRENLGRSSLLGLVALARSPQEEKKFRAALYLIDPRTSLDAVQVSAKTTTAGDEDASAPQELLRALRLLRTGKGPTARAIAEKPAVAKLLETYSRILTRAEFNAASGQAVLSPRELRQTLLLELEMESLVHPASNTEPAAASAHWSRELQGKGGKAVPSLSLETLTEFDPRKCMYRDGKWVERE